MGWPPGVVLYEGGPGDEERHDQQQLYSCVCTKLRPDVDLVEFSAQSVRAAQEIDRLCSKRHIVKPDAQDSNAEYVRASFPEPGAESNADHGTGEELGHYDLRSPTDPAGGPDQIESGETPHAGTHHRAASSGLGAAGLVSNNTRVMIVACAVGCLEDEVHALASPAAN